MPGGRLTQRDRRQIALGLADGLAYAEIARGLERPTSTITREVMRNGGPAGYRADLAHRATEQRSRRRGQAASRTPERTAQPHGRDAGAVREYEEQFVTVMMQSGLPRMMARVMVALLLTDAGSMTAAELARHLQVSPATISKSITFLESQSLVSRKREDGRRERYVIDDDLWYQSMESSIRALVQQVEIARQGVGVLGPGTPAAVRLENVARFLDFVGESLTRAVHQARDILSSKADAASPAGAAGPAAERDQEVSGP